MTTTPQTEAIRLADELQSHNDERLYREADELMHEAAIELRRLDALCDERGANEARMLMRCTEMQATIDQLRARLDAKPMPEWDSKAYMQAIANLRERLAALEAERDQLRAQVERLQGGEPVAWMLPRKGEDRAEFHEASEAFNSSIKTLGWTPLYTAQPAAPAVPVTDEYAGVIAWIGDKQCKLILTGDAIKHEHTPGVVMRNTAHVCVQQVIIAALREKEGK